MRPEMSALEPASTMGTLWKGPKGDKGRGQTGKGKKGQGKAQHQPRPPDTTYRGAGVGEHTYLDDVYWHHEDHTHQTAPIRPPEQYPANQRGKSHGKERHEWWEPPATSEYARNDQYYWRQRQ